ncbi:MAG: NAD(P)H-dependent oxidoreductase subunit E [Proteobacteria bacterium]|nr:NAD(P)H-dependent oxidoreductase subunit E [Pseudomonadota bacterium]
MMKREEMMLGKILKKYRLERSALVPILQDIQAEYSYLPEPVLRQISREMKIPLTEVVGVATFYKSLSLIPRGRHHLQVCLGTACHVRGAPRVLEEVERHLCVCAGQTTKDGEFSLGTVNCVGACALGPIVIVDGKYHGKMSALKTSALVKKTMRGG